MNRLFHFLSYKLTGKKVGQIGYTNASPHIVWNIMGPGGDWNNPIFYRYKKWKWNGFKWKYLETVEIRREVKK